MVRINGENYEAAGKTVKTFLEENGYNLARIVVELNQQIIDKDTYDSVVMADGDVLEVVSFVGGG